MTRTLALTLAALLTPSVALAKSKKALRREISTLESENAQLLERIAALEAENHAFRSANMELEAMLFESPYADLSHMNLAHVRLDEVILENIDMTGVLLHDAFAARASFFGSTLTQAVMYDSDMASTDFRTTDLDGADMVCSSFIKTFSVILKFG